MRKTTSLARFLRRLHSDERGIAAIFLGLSLAAVVGLAALAVDVGWMQYNRSSLQTAADAGALAGAGTLLAKGSDLSAVRDASLTFGRANLLSGEQPAKAITNTDVGFLCDGVPCLSMPNQVEVTAGFEAARGNPLQLFLAGVIGTPTADVSASARAGVVGVCESACLKPFSIPAKFTWDDTCDPDSKKRNNGKLDPDSACEMASIDAPGYTDADAGTQVLLKPGDPHDAFVPSFYNLVNFPPKNKGNPVTGGSELRDNIAGCTASNSVVVQIEDELQIEPGNSMGPVKQGISDLIAQDAGAYWDSATNSIKGSAYANPLDSPRVSLMAFYDPKRPPTSGRNTIFVQQVGAIFIESLSGNGDVQARFVRAVAKGDVKAGGDCMLKVSRMLRDSGRGG